MGRIAKTQGVQEHSTILHLQTSLLGGKSLKKRHYKNKVMSSWHSYKNLRHGAYTRTETFAFARLICLSLSDMFREIFSTTGL